MAHISPVAEGLFEMTPDGPRLLGTQCTSCGTLYFPQAAGCRNPSCQDKRIETTRLPAGGTLYSYTIQRYQPPPLFRYDDWSPYPLAVADLGQGLHVMGMLLIEDFTKIEIGMPLRLVTKILTTDTQGGSVATYAFEPEVA